MDPFRTVLAMGPLAVYLVLLGVINSRRRPFLTTGIRDTYALGVAVSGFALVGPVELFMPSGAADQFGPYVWLLLIVFYGLCLTLMALIRRPRLIIFNIAPEQVSAVLNRLVARLQLDHQWAGETLVLPTWGVQLHFERFHTMRNVSLVATTADQSFRGWRRLEHELDTELGSVKAEFNPISIVLMSIGLLMLGSAYLCILVRSELVAEGLKEMLRM